MTVLEAAVAAEPILSISGLTIVRRDRPKVTIVDDVSLTLRRGEALGIAGESGCGKTTTALAVIGLLPSGLKRASGEIALAGPRGPRPLHKASGAAMRKIRWAKISMIFQGAMNALDPVKTVGAQIAEPIALHEPKLSRSAVSKRVSELLDQVGVASKRAVYYPHEFSGGQKQRIMIALALACRPDVVIADEPTTALDVITQAQILDLLGDLRRELGLSLLMITHDLAVLAQACEHVAVMYAGQVVEIGPVAEVYRAPQHPYTARLLDLLGADDAPGTLPEPIPGSQPRPEARPAGCRFHDRCAFATELCAAEPPPLWEIGEAFARCHYAPWHGGRVPDRPGHAPELSEFASPVAGIASVGPGASAEQIVPAAQAAPAVSAAEAVPPKNSAPAEIAVPTEQVTPTDEKESP